MNNTTQLANRLREVLLNGTWVANTNYKDQLENINWEIANSNVDSLNSISLLARHVHYYINGIKNVFEGGELEIRDKYSFDFQPIGSQEEWEELLLKFWKDSEQLVQLLEKTPNDRLNQSFVQEKYGTYQRNIDGLIEHCYYHLGQIVLIKKILSQNK